jgi:hypothetical protein
MTFRMTSVLPCALFASAALVLSSCHQTAPPTPAPVVTPRPSPPATGPAAPSAASPTPIASVKSGLPTPESVWGFAPGQDNRLATYDQSVEYFKKLAAASKNIQLFEAGKSSEGRTFYYAAISTTENLAKLDHYREIAQRIAHPEGLSDDDAHALAREGKVLLHIDGGLHATESAGPQHTPLLAYDILRRANEPDMHAELDNVILLLWPTINPDGQQMVAEYAAANQGRQFPGLYQAYVGHDNNRDAYMLNMIESRVMEHAWRAWEPDIIHVHHQGAPAPSRIWFPPFAEPIATWAPALMSREVNVIGTAMARAEDEAGHVGSSHMGRPYDAWYPGYIDYNPMFKNIVAYWTETAANGGGGGGRGGPAGEPERPQSLYSSPWTPGSPWNLRSAIEYMETASLAVLDFAARYKDSIIYDRYQAGRDQIARGRAQAPYAYVIPQDQGDPVAPVELLRRLAFSGVRVSQLTAAATIDGSTYPAGTWVVPADQEFAAVAREVLDVQKYPEVRPAGPTGPLDQPYDAAGWTLPLTMQVTVTPAATPLAPETRSKLKLLGPQPDLKVKLTPYNMTAVPDAAPFDSVPGIGFNSSPNAAAIVPLIAPITGTGPTLSLDAAQNNAFRALNRAWKAGLSVQLALGSAGAHARFLIAGLSETDQQELVNTLALKATRTTETGASLKKPRIGLFEPGNESIDAGWTRWLFEQYGFDLVTLHADDFHTPLHDKVDVVILASDVRLPTAGGGRGGRGGGAGAVAAGGGGAGATTGGTGRAATPPAAGAPAGRGGGAADAVTADDLKAFEDFVRAGGTVVCLNGASTFAIQQFNLPVRNVLANVNRQEFFTGGSVLEVQVDPLHPVMAGMPAKAAIFVDSSPAFETTEGFKGAILARYQDSGSPLLSGFMQGEKYLNGKAAAVDVALDQGHVILLGFRPQWRDQTFGTFKVLFNAALFTH